MSNALQNLSSKQITLLCNLTGYNTTRIAKDAVKDLTFKDVTNNLIPHSPKSNLQMAYYHSHQGFLCKE